MNAEPHAKLLGDGTDFPQKRSCIRPKIIRIHSAIAIQQASDLIQGECAIAAGKSLKNRIHQFFPLRRGHLSM